MVGPRPYLSYATGLVLLEMAGRADPELNGVPSDVLEEMRALEEAFEDATAKATAKARAIEEEARAKARAIEEEERAKARESK